MPVTSSSQLRSTDTHAMSSSVPASLSSSSLSSSISSSRASSDLLPVAPLSNSSQSDIITSDRSVSSLSSSKGRFFPLVSTSTSDPPRSASLATMGQNQARSVALPASPPPLSPAPSTTSSTGNRFKRAWAGRRKKSEDTTFTFSGSERAKAKEKERERGAVPHPPSAMPDLNELSLERPQSRGLGGTKLHLPSVFGGKKTNQQQKQSPTVRPDILPTPPPPPPKSVSIDQRAPSSSPPHTSARDAQFSTFTAVTKSRTFINSIQPSGQPLEGGVDAGTSTEKSASSQDKVKEDWRKSDSTMASNSTIRPGALSGNRSPRPVSLAESSHSTTTIVAPVKRLSALITDAEFTMFEETDGSVSEHDTIPRPPASGRPSPTHSLKVRNRRSASLSLVPPRRPEASSSAGRNFTDNPLTSPRDTATLTRAAAAGIISPASADGHPHSASNNIRGRLAAWTAASAAAPQPQPERALPTLPPPQPRRPADSLNCHTINPTFRQTAVSMTGSLAPAAGIAMGFGKRAVEKVGRAWGGLTSSASNHSGYSSSSSTGMSDSASASSHHSGPSGRKARRRAPHAFSNASSISSLASSSSEDHYSIAGPQLGKRLRGPRLSESGLSIVGGLVFKRPLQICVRETAIDDVLAMMRNGQEEADTFGFRPLEARLLPALILRCAQHILRRGMEEEGLFRISGRSSHVAKLRADFDAGADYLLSECEPGDLDPHAVSSIFKTFLREMPEPVLTFTLLPYFESALADDHGRRSEDVTQEVRTPISSTGDSHLPLRKPPSLSTLAMPTFAGARAISDAQLNAFSWLISKLPRENRDLLYTVVELIKVTAAHSKETKMPLGNLLLVFCPSLNMSPSLLRVLCEAVGIWNGPPTQPAVSHVQANRSTDAATTDGHSTHPRSVSRSLVPAINLRLPVIELDDTPDSLRDSPDDTASFVSALEPSSNAPRTPSPLIYGITVPTLSSSDSLDSSSVSEELASPDPPPDGDAGDNKSFTSAHSLAIPECPVLSVSALPRPPISVPFPSGGGSVPHSPVTHQPLTHRKSHTLLSFPHRSESTSDTGFEEECPPKRPKRPSLHLLFSKKSTSSLPSAASTRNIPASALGPANGTNVRLNTHIASSPPRLDTAISSSPIYLGFDANVKQLGGKDSATVRSAPSVITCPTKLVAPALDSRSDSGGSSLFSTPQSTPIADYYRGRTTSLVLPDTPAEMALPPRARSVSQVSETPSIDIEVAETQDDWTQSVLLAAQTERGSRT